LFAIANCAPLDNGQSYWRASPLELLPRAEVLSWRIFETANARGVDHAHENWSSAGVESEQDRPCRWIPANEQLLRRLSAASAHE
jgi:hypothetical protein